MFKKEVAKEEMKAQERGPSWIAKRLDLSSASIRRYLSGRSPCTKTVAEAWARHLGLPIDRFWQENEQQKAG